MNFSDEGLFPVEAWCDHTHLHAKLANGSVITVPVWWYPRLASGTMAQRNDIVLSPLGLHWDSLDEDIKIEGMILGWKDRNAVAPVMDAAE